MKPLNDSAFLISIAITVIIGSIALYKIMFGEEKKNPNKKLSSYKPMLKLTSYTCFALMLILMTSMEINKDLGLYDTSTTFSPSMIFGVLFVISPIACYIRLSGIMDENILLPKLIKKINKYESASKRDINNYTGFIVSHYVISQLLLFSAYFFISVGGLWIIPGIFQIIAFVFQGSIFFQNPRHDYDEFR